MVLTFDAESLINIELKGNLDPGWLQLLLFLTLAHHVVLQKVHLSCFWGTLSLKDLKGNKSWEQNAVLRHAEQKNDC